MNIYVDFDDCLCETARHFSGLAKDMFGTNVPYENINFFNLQKSFSLTDKQYEDRMAGAHKPEILLSYAETPGAADTLNSWVDEGHDVSVITGRPFNSFEPSKEWLDRHGLGRIKLYCLNKYGRDSFYQNTEYSLELDDYYKMHFDIAVEDSPHAFKFFDHLPDLKILVYDRPWNHNVELPGDNYIRCFDWNEIERNAK